MSILRILLHLAFGHCDALTEGRKEGHFMKTKLLTIMLLAGGSIFAQTRVSIGIGLGGHGAGFYQPPPSYASIVPPCPGPDFIWVDGYWSQNHGRNTWVAGYWNRRPFSRGFQVAPRFDNRFNDGPSRGGNFSGQNRNQTRGFDQDQTRDFGKNQNQNQNRSFGNQDQNGNRNRSNTQDNRQGNGYANGYRGR
jgi:hypothetical protein